MSTKSKEPSEDDVIVARALTSYAQLRANIASWSGLPADSTGLSGDPNDEVEEPFTAESERAGVGYVAHPDGERTKTSTDKLRKQMLGKWTRGGNTGLERVGGPKKMAGSRRGIPRDVKEDEDSEEDEGRSAVGKKRKHRTEPAKAAESSAELVEMSVANTSSTVIQKAPTSYLDEILAKRTKKRAKKPGKDPEIV